MQGHFKEWGRFDKEEKVVKEAELVNESEIENAEGIEASGTVKEVVSCSEQLLLPNSFERVYSLDGARKYLVHADDPNKYQYSPLSVETNDKFFINLFLPRTDEITATKNLVRSFKLLSQCETFDEFLSGFEADMYRLPHSYRINLVMTLRRYYNEYKNNEHNKDGFDKHPPRDDGFVPVESNINYQVNLENDLPF